jgi:hypothetical protein
MITMSNVQNKKLRNKQQKENESDKRDYSDREDEIFNIGRDSFPHQKKRKIKTNH